MKNLDKLLLGLAVVSAFGGLLGVEGMNTAFSVFITGWVLMKTRPNLEK